MADALITTKKFVPKRQDELEAVQVTEENIEQVAQLVGCTILTTAEGDRILPVSRGSIAWVGDYICKRPRGSWFKLSREFFERTYDEGF